MALVRWLRLAVLAVALLLSRGALAEEVPQLVLETGGHLGIVKSVAFTARGNYLLSAGDDKAVRVWDVVGKRTAFVLRGQSGPGKEGKIAALAVSPDDRWIAVGGWFSVDGALEPCCGDVRLYDLAERKLVAVLSGHTDALTSLAFSPDGRHLLSGSADKTAILWDTANRSVRHRLSPQKGAVNAVAFVDGGNTAVTGAADGHVQLWRVADGAPKQEFRIGAEVMALAVQPGGKAFAAGGRDGEIRTFDLARPASSRVPVMLGAAVRALAYKADGSGLLATCDCLDNAVRAIDLATGTAKPVYGLHDNTVTALAVQPDGKRIASAGGSNHEIHLWEADSGQTLARLAGGGRTVWSVGFGRDADRIAWGTEDPCPEAASCPNIPGSLSWVMALPTENLHLGDPQPIPNSANTDFRRSDAALGTWTLAHKPHPSLNQRDAVLEIRDGKSARAAIERDATSGTLHSAYSFTPDGKRIVSGGVQGALALYDLDGRKLGDFVGHTGQIWSVAMSADGRFLLSGSLDQTVHLWNLATQELIVSLFKTEAGDWIAWTPQGYYTGSPGADRLVGWQINRGPDEIPDHVGADQLGRHLDRPDVIQRAIILGSAEAAIQSSEGTNFRLADLLSQKVPAFRIVAPQDGARALADKAQVTIAIATNIDPVKLIAVEVNGAQVARIAPAVGSGGIAPGELRLDVPLNSGSNHVRVSLVNDVGERSEMVTLDREGDGALDQRGTLYVVAVGVDKYPGLGERCGPKGKSSCDLRFAGVDARTLAATVEKRLGATHGAVVKRVLTDDGDPGNAPTAANILDAIDLFKNAKVTDTIVLFVAGHGINEGGSYRFLAGNSEWSGKSLRSSTVVTWYSLQEALELAKGRRILLVDTCHSGNSYNPRLGNAAYRANIIAFTATRFDQLSLEDSAVGHGLFTLAAIEALEGKPPPGGGRLSTKDMATYLSKRVSELAQARGAAQDPQYFRGRDAEDYVLAQQ